MLAAGVLEVGFVTLLKLSDGLTKIAPTVGFFVMSFLSFFCLTKAMQGIPMATAYSIWTGIGATGAMIVSVVYFGEHWTYLRAFFLLLLLAGIVGLKLTLPAR